MFYVLFISLIAFSKADGEGVPIVAEQYIEQVLAAYPGERAALQSASDELANPSDYPSDYTPHDGEEVDFLVLGLGSAGCVVAKRLSEESGWNVLGIEAGGDPVKTIEVPNLLPYLFNSEVDWAYRTAPDGKSCLSMTDKRCAWPRGKVLGGSSSINHMLYLRGNKRDYDRWEASGCPGWGYEDVLPYFKKSEDMRDKIALASSPGYHSTGGHLKVERFSDLEEIELLSRITKGMEELGYKSSPDANGNNQTGYAIVQGTLYEGRRCSVAKAFLTPYKNRDNLKVCKHSLVTKILIDNKKRAYGIEFIKNGKTITVYAKKEIILSAGSFNSPQLLMLSGIGPKEHLQELNITVVSDLPVGENLQDHQFNLGLVFTTNFSTSPSSSVVEMYKFLKKKASRFGYLRSNSRAGFISTTNNYDWPETEFLMANFEKNDSVSLTGWLSGNIHFGPEIHEQIVEINKKASLTYPLGCYLRPYGRGRVRLNSTNPTGHPILTSGYFSDDRDFDIMLGFYKFIEELTKTEGLRSVGAELHEITVPECAEHEFASREYRICSLRHLTSSAYHQAGSCKMGDERDSSTVVDPTLRVKGVTGLRVCDASIMPFVVGSNINAPTVMIGEKGADLIKSTWLKKV